MHFFRLLKGLKNPMLRKYLFLFNALTSVLVLVFLISPGQAQAAVIESGPPMDVLTGNETAGGGAYIPLIQFRLTGDGSSTLTNVRVGILSTTTTNNLNNGEINKLYLYKDSGVSMGFQPNEDTLLNTSSNIITDPATSTTLTITVDTASNSIATTPTDFFVVVRATTTAAIVNGHGLYATTTANWITTSTGTIGTEFVATKRITLQQTANIKISEVKQGATSNAGDEFIELYNASELPIDLSVLPLNLYVFNSAGGATAKGLTYFSRTIIPKQGFFLLASQVGYNNSMSPDAVFSTAANDIGTAGGLSISTSSTLTNATSSAIDRIWFGAAAGAADGEGTQLDNLAVDKSYERKALEGSTNTTMASGGADSGKGNGRDSNDNSQDFVLQNSPMPQNSLSPTEFPFGGGGSDNEKPRVMGSFPGPNQTVVPIDISFIGFGFNKMVRSGTIVSATATTTVTLTTGGGANLCTSITYNQSPGNYEPPAKCMLSAALSPSTTYTFTATSTILDLTGNPLDQNPFTGGNQAYSITFTTGGSSQTMTNITPPRVTGTTPFPGSNNIPTNLAKIFVKFNIAMDSSSLTSSNVSLTSSIGAVLLSGFSYDASTTMLSFVPASLSANTTYTITLGTGGARSSNNITLPSSYVSVFTTGAGTDSSAPIVTGVVPSQGMTLLLTNLDFVFSTDDNIDFSTATTGAVTLSTGGNNLPGTVSYDPIAKEGHFTASNLLPAGVSDLTLTLKAGALKNVSGLQMTQKTYTWSTEASNTDATPPSVLFANADDFGVAVTFNEAVKSYDASTLTNYSLTVGGVAITLSSMAGHNISYEPSTRTAKIAGLLLSPNSSFTVSVNNIPDMAGNTMTSASTFTGTVQSQQSSMGMLGPGQFSGDVGPRMTDFSSAGIGFMPGMKVMPMNAFISASTTYGFELPISQRIPASGTIVITFPQSSDFGLCCAATTDANNQFVTNQNSDINGPGDNTVGFGSIAKNSTAKTITLTLSAATNTEGHDFLRFAIVDIKNPSIPKDKDSSGYALDIKTKNSSGVLLESFTSSPIYITGGAVGGSATTTIQGSVTGRGTGLVGVTVRMGSPQTGMMTATSNSSGNYQFANIPANDQISSFGNAGTEYMLFTDSIISGISDVNGATTTAFFGESMPTPVRATSTSIITRNFVLTATSSAIDFAIKLTGDNSANGIFSSGEKIDIFAGGPGKSLTQTYTTIATNYSATQIALIPIPQINGSWGIGIQPAMPKMMGNMNFAPPAPTWAVPKPVEVIVSGCPSSCTMMINGSTANSYTYTVSAANRTIAGILRDGSGNLVSSAEVFAFSPGQGIGNRAQTSSAGVFSIRVSSGSYNVGAFVPGMGRSREVTVVVDSSGNVYVDGSTTASTGASGSNPFTLTIKKSSYTITGSVSDGTNAVANASVFAYRYDGPGHIDAITDSSGNYTLYVDTGIWKVNSFIPGFGPMTEQTVTISSASQSNINFSPSTATTYRMISGIVFESADSSIATSTEGISGVIIRVSGTNGTNETITGSDGSYSLRVPSGTYSFVDIFKPGYGRIAPVSHTLSAITSINASAGDVYKAIRVNSRNTIQVVVKDSDGNALTVSKAFIDLFDPTYQVGNHAEITNGTTTTLQIATGTTPMIRAFVQGVPPSNVSVASDNALTVVSSGSFTVDNSTEYIKIVVNTSSASLSTISGKVYAGSAVSGNELADAWVQFVDPTNNVHFGTQATSTGVYLLKIANGTYQVQAMKPGYVGTPTSLIVNGSTSSANFVVTQAASAITGSVTAGGSVATDAFVWAEKLGGGFSATKTNTAGTFSLSVDSGQWKVYAAAEGYQKAGGSTVSAGATGVTIALSTAAGSNVSSKLATSNTFTDTSSSSFSDTDVGVKVALDSGTLGNSGTSAYMSAKETTNLPDTLDTNIIGDKGVDIDATNGSSAVTNLQSGKKAEITLTYTKAELAADGIDTTTEAGNLKIVSWSDDKKAWESLTTVMIYKDSSGNPISSPASDLSDVSTIEFTTAEATHFSEYALSAPSNADAPATPSGLTVSQSATALSVTLTWTGNSDSDLSGYYLYRDTSGSGSFPLLSNVGNTTTYTNGGLTVGTTYYYKVSAYDTGGNESAASGAVSIAIQARGGSGGSPSIGATAGGGGSSAAATTPAATQTTPAASLVAKPSAVAQVVSPVFNKTLSPGNRSQDVRRLQELLKLDKTVYPAGEVTGYYGPATAKAVKAFQKKYGIAQTGTLGPATRTKIQQVFAETPAAVTSTAVSPVAKPSVVAVPDISSVFTKTLSSGSQGDDVKRLQQLLKQDKSVYPEGVANGVFGPATQRAVKAFQKKYGIDQTGTLGPATRAKIQEVFVEEAAAPVTSVSTKTTTSSAKVKLLQKQLLELQKILQQSKKKK